VDIVWLLLMGLGWRRSDGWWIGHEVGHAWKNCSMKLTTPFEDREFARTIGARGAAERERRTPPTAACATVTEYLDFVPNSGPHFSFTPRETLTLDDSTNLGDVSPESWKLEAGDLLPGA